MAGEEPGRVAESAAPPPSARIALWILIALAVLSPWPFGSTPRWAVLTLAGLSLGGALAVSVVQASQGTLQLAGGPLWPVAIFVSLGLLQLIPVPAALHEIAAPGSASVWHPAERAASALLGAGARPISIYPAATASWLGTSAGLIALTMLAVPALNRRRTMIAAAWTLVGAGTLVAVYGIVARTVFGPLLYGYIAVPTVSPFGPFVNKNHFAGYVEMAALLAVGLGHGLWRQSASASGGSIDSLRPRVLIAFGAVAGMAMAVLASLSRGGALGLISGMAVFLAVDAATSRHQARRRTMVSLAALGVLVAVVVALLPGEAYERLFRTRWRQDDSALFRLATWKDSAQAALSSPVFGQGMGAFAEVLPRYKTVAGNFRVEHPENELVELAVEGGLVAVLAAAAALVVGFRGVVRGIRGHRDRVVRGIVAGAVSGVAGVCVHGLVDFNLHIPSNAVMFLALAALSLGPLGSRTARGVRAWAFVAVLVTAALVATARRPPALAEARALALKASSTHDAVTRGLRLSMAEARSRDYLSRRPADPEGWLLAAWTRSVTGLPREGAALANYAVTLDPRRAALVEAARNLTAAIEPIP